MRSNWSTLSLVCSSSDTSARTLTSAHLTSCISEGSVLKLTVTRADLQRLLTSMPWSPRASLIPQVLGSGDIGLEHLFHYQATAGSDQAQTLALPDLSQHFHT